MKTDENSYRSILKGVSALASVQVFQILAQLIRGKFAALLLGPEGMGISSIFNTASNTISRTSSLGLNLAIVREAADCRDSPDRLSRLLGVSIALSRLTALLGAAVCILFAIPLSRLSFGSPDYAWQFALLAVAVWLTVTANARLSILQGLHKVKRLAKASLVGALAGIFVGVPLYWLFADKGIVPAIIAMQLSLWVFYTVNLRHETGPLKPDYRFRQHYPIVKRLLTLGLVLLSGDIIGSLCEYGINVFLRNAGSLDTVGLYQAANSLTKQYSGIVFTAMSLDYFPRLVAAIKNHNELQSIVSRQMEIVALGIAPLACLAMAFGPLIIKLLLTQQFQQSLPLFRLMSVGIVLKALSFPLAYITFANNNKRLYFWLEAIGCNLLFVFTFILGYHTTGLIGIGWACIVENALCIILYTVVNRKVYGLFPSAKAWAVGAGCAILVACCYTSSAIEGPTGNLLMWTSVISATALSGYSLKRLLKK